MSMARPHIQIGFRVGKLEVAAPTEKRKNGYTVWKCCCDCGNEILLDTRALQRGAIRDCGCGKVKPGMKDLTGQRFGRLVCLEPTDQRGKSGGTVWRCRCDCGNTCLAISTQLTQGYKKSCGCWGHPPLKDFVGKRFGMLTVLAYDGKRDGMHRWRCLCDCGKETIVGQTLLQSGKTKSCGCNGNPPMEDITGRVFGRLTALRVEKWEKGTAYWRCRCECGKETIVRYGYLMDGHTKSCGCLQRSMLRDNLKLCEGTSVTALESNRIIASNTSGYTGVYWNARSQKWVAQITFKRKTYYLGSYSRIEDAVKDRKKAEGRLFGAFLDWYYSEYQTKSRLRQSVNAPEPSGKGVCKPEKQLNSHT